jgi:hypothetical protein
MSEWWSGNDAAWSFLEGLTAADLQVLYGLNDVEARTIAAMSPSEMADALYGVEHSALDPTEVEDDPVAGLDAESGECLGERGINDINYLSQIYRMAGEAAATRDRNFFGLRNFFDSQLNWSEFTPVVEIKYAEVNFINFVLPGDLLVRYEPFMPSIVGMIEAADGPAEIDAQTEYKEVSVKVWIPRFPTTEGMTLESMELNLDDLKGSRFTYILRSTLASAGNLYRIGYETLVRGTLPP